MTDTGKNHSDSSLVMLLAGKCFDGALKDVRLPQHATLQGYEANLEWNIHRWCGYWGRGI